MQEYCRWGWLQWGLRSSTARIGARDRGRLTSWTKLIDLVFWPTSLAKLIDLVFRLASLTKLIDLVFRPTSLTKLIDLLFRLSFTRRLKVHVTKSGICTRCFVRHLKNLVFNRCLDKKDVWGLWYVWSYDHCSFNSCDLRELCHVLSVAMILFRHTGVGWVNIEKVAAAELLQRKTT